MKPKKSNSDLLNPVSSNAFAVTSVPCLQTKSKSELINEVFRLQTLLNQICEIAEEKSGSINQFELHPMVRLRQLLRKTASDNLK
jgi:hypothetical protein